MLILQEVQSSFSSMGFSPKLKRFNNKVRAILATTVPGFILLWIYLIHVASTAREYMESIDTISPGTGVLLSFTYTIFTSKKVFSVINSIAELVHGSKC